MPSQTLRNEAIRFAASPRSHRAIALTCSAMLALAGVQFAGLYSLSIMELLFPPTPAPEYSLALDLGAASLIVEVIIMGMFIGHLALLGLAGIGAVPQSGKGKAGTWLAAFSWLGLACACLIAVVLGISGEMELLAPDSRSELAAMAAYVSAGAVLIALRMIGNLKNKRYPG